MTSQHPPSQLLEMSVWAELLSIMPAQRLQASLFPNCPPYLKFLGPNQSYEDGEDAPKELVLKFTVAKGTSVLVIECLQRFGVSIIQVILLLPSK